MGEASVRLGRTGKKTKQKEGWRGAPASSCDVSKRHVSHMPCFLSSWLLVYKLVRRRVARHLPRASFATG